MKVLVLIISDDSRSIYKKHRDIWKLYMNLNPTFKCLFLTSKPNISQSFVDVYNNTLYVPGDESIVPGIFNKTVKAIDYFKNDNYDYVIRTNLSSVWNFNKFKEVLRDAPREKVYFGLSFSDFFAISGSGITMSKDVYMLLLNVYEDIDYTLMDDLVIGSIMKKNVVKISLGTRDNVEHIHLPINNFFYHWRCKQINDDSKEILIMEKIVKNIYSRRLWTKHVATWSDRMLFQNTHHM